MPKSRTFSSVSVAVRDPTEGADSRNPMTRSQRMRFTVPLSLVAALLGAAALASPARAGHCGACNYPVSAAYPEQCEVASVRYRICYQTVFEDRVQTCYRQVPRTTMKECRTTVMRPVY